MTDSAKDLAPYCSLDRSALRDRIAWIRQIFPRASRTEALPHGRAWDFPADSALEQELEALIEKERECCGEGITFLLRKPEANTLRLEVHGIEPDAAIFRAIHAGARGSGWRRVAGSGALGLALAFTLFCALPWAAVLVFGAALAAPLLALDQPWLVATGALVAAAGFWAIASRRGAEENRRSC